ncbi:MAG: glycosyltransferase [Bacteroidia bacterium]|nr:glycosyltransferase [Bacteroidia bacterium]
MPLLSIITINYNNAKGLQKTMDSVFTQLFGDFEYLIIDGGSTDGSEEIIKQHSSKLAHFVSEKDQGIYHAQNKGIEAANGKYLLFLNSGDFLCNNKVLQTVFKSEPIADIVYGNMRINWGNNSISTGTMPDVISVEHMYRDTLWHPVSFIKRELFLKFGNYNQQYKLVADYDFFFRVIIKNKVSTQHIDVEVAEYNTDGQSSNTANKKQEQAERRRVMESYLGAEELDILDKELNKKPSFFKRISERLKGKK